MLFKSVKFTPSKKTLPLVGDVNPIMLLPVVDFPHPLSPTNPSVSPGCKLKLIFSTACILPPALPKSCLIKNLVVKPLTSSNGEEVLLTVSFISTTFFVEIFSLFLRPEDLTSLTLRLINFAGSFLPTILPSFGTAANKDLVYGCLGFWNISIAVPSSTFLPANITTTLSATSATTPIS